MPQTALGMAVVWVLQKGATTQWMVKMHLKSRLCLWKTLIVTIFVECTADRQFVFEIRNNLPSVNVDTTKLYILGHPECKPVFVNNEVAIFKFGVGECGVRSYVSCFCPAQVAQCLAFVITQGNAAQNELFLTEHQWDPDLPD